MSQVDFESQPYNAQVSEQPARSGCGCWAWGCLSVFVIGVLGTIGIGVGGWMFVSNQVQTYTADAPSQLPEVQYEPDEIAALEERIETFKKEAEQGTQAEELVLTATDLNALIQSNEKLRGKVFAKIEDGKVGGDVSIPTDAIPGGKGRFFNANATFDISMSDGVLIVTLAAAEVKGEPVPKQIIEAMAKENLAKDAYKDPETAKMMRRVESITIKDDKIILKLKPQPGQESVPISEEAAGPASEGASSEVGTSEKEPDGEDGSVIEDVPASEAESLKEAVQQTQQMPVQKFDLAILKNLEQGVEAPQEPSVDGEHGEASDDEVKVVREAPPKRDTPPVRLPKMKPQPSFWERIFGPYFTIGMGLKY